MIKELETILQSGYTARKVRERSYIRATLSLSVNRCILIFALRIILLRRKNLLRL